MLDIDAVKRVIERRRKRGATDEEISSYLESLKSGAWKRHPEDIDELLDELEN